MDSLRAVNASAPVLSELGGRLSAAREAEQRRQEAERRRLEAERARLAAEEAERLRSKPRNISRSLRKPWKKRLDKADAYVDSAGS